MRGYCGVTGGTVLVCLLAILAGAAAGASQPTRASFSVTLQGTVTKQWNTVREGTEGDCQVTRRTVGRRTVTLRSSRPTTVVVTLGTGRVSFSPSAARFVALEVTQSSEQTTRRAAPCAEETQRARCPRSRRSVTGGSFRFFRSRRNEISFHRARLPEKKSSCLREPAVVRTIRPSLREARGEFSEAALANARIPSQTAIAWAEVTTELEGPEAGSVVERVRWALTFTRKR